MLAHEAADDRFLLLSADLAVGKARVRLARIAPGMLRGVVVSYDDSSPRYRLLRPAEFFDLVNGALPDDRAPIADLLGDVPPTQVVSPYADVTALTRAVVVDAGRPVGVILPVSAGIVDIESDLWESMTFSTPPAPLSGGEIKGLEPPQPAMPEPAATPAAAPGAAARRADGCCARPDRAGRAGAAPGAPDCGGRVAGWLHAPGSGNGQHNRSARQAAPGRNGGRLARWHRLSWPGRRRACPCSSSYALLRWA